MKWFLLIAIALIALCPMYVVAGEPQAIIVWKLDAGYYVVSGSQIVAFPPSGPVVPPVDPPVVPPTPDNDFSKAVINAVMTVPASDNRNTAALKLSKVYEMLAGQKLPPAKAVEAVSTIVNLGLGSDKGTLESVYVVVNAAIAKCQDEAAVSDVLSEAADAVGSTVPVSAGEDEQDTAQRYGIDWDVFLKFVMDLLIKLLPIILAL